MREANCFFLNGKKIEITTASEPGLRPDMTLLNWLRLHQKLTGTKEGCAEGDCGDFTQALEFRALFSFIIAFLFPIIYLEKPLRRVQ